jgi:D-amino-acid oxidase
LSRAGIIGLTIALKLQELLSNKGTENGTGVLLVAREWPSTSPHASGSINYASMWAGAHVRPIPGTTTQLRREAAWLKKTVQEFSNLLEEKPWVGISKTMGIEFIEAPSSDYKGQTADTFTAESGLSEYRELTASDKPAGTWLGFEYATYCVNPPVYCENLLRTFVFRGGRMLSRNLKSEWEAFSLENNVSLVVNASGKGFGDPHCFPTRGLYSLFITVDHMINLPGHLK